MARVFRRKQSAHPIADLNVTNLIDLGFMLLIIFMVVTPLMQQEQRIPVNLPIEATSVQPTPNPKDRNESIIVQADGRVQLGDRPISLKQLDAELAKFAAESKPPVIHLRLDAKATAQQFVSVMESLKKHNLTRIAFDTQVAR